MSTWPPAETPNPSILLHGSGQAALSNLPTPQSTDPDDVLVRIAYVGCCGSDVHFWTHGGIGAHKVVPDRPLVMGHEASGIIAATGPGCTTLRVGDRVAIEPGFPCRRCRDCKNGRYNLCPEMRFAADPGDVEGKGVGAVGGTLCKYFRLPEDFCYKLGEEVELHESVLVEPLAVAVHVVRLADVRVGQSVVVMGGGTIGMLCAAVVKAFGAREIVVCDLVGWKLEFARGFVEGIKTFEPDLGNGAEQEADRLREECRLGEGADVLLEATGAESSIQTGVFVLKKGGTFVQAGLGKNLLTVPMVTLSEKELNVRGCFRYASGDFELALELLKSGQVPVKKLISSEVPFERATEAWEKTKRGEGIKNLIRGVQD